MTHLPAAKPHHYTARTERIPDPGDLLDHLGAGGFAWLDGGETGFVTDGCVARIAVRDAATLLAGIDHVVGSDAPNAPPRVVGALPFEGGGEVVLPSVTVGRDATGRAWRTTIDGAPTPAALRVTHARPGAFDVRPGPGTDNWEHMVERALDEIAARELEKVVLSRAVDIVADAPFDVADTLAELRTTQPGCTVYAAGGFVGASPELLVRRCGDAVTARPMAGTGNDPEALRASTKDLHEHRIVVDAIVAALSECCASVEAVGPLPMLFANVAHLATTVHGRLRTAGDASSALDLVHRLHPTPAVGGAPTHRARALLRTLEGAPRGQYAGPCGWVDAQGDGEFVVALRCALLDGAHARLFAGAGIVAGSEPTSEFAETQAKLQPMLRALVRP